MFIFMIIILSILYYTFGWICYHYMDRDHNPLDSGLINFGYAILTLFGLGIVPIIHLIVCFITNLINLIIKRTNKYKVYTRYSTKEEGLGSTGDTVYYCLSELSLMGYMNLNYCNLTSKQANKVIKILTKWADTERLKWLKLNAYNEIRGFERK